jgi:UDP-N-acetylglucosamine 2-epimerase (non-hydrolysing)
MTNVRKKIAVVLGTRPDAIKLAPVVGALRRDADAFETRVIFTSQHRDLAASILDYFDIIPDFDLEVMTEAQSPSDVAARVLERIDPILRAERPDMVLVQGDTTTAMAAALGAFHRAIPVGHVEAGLRTGDRYNPFPEEMNRRLVTQLASLHFAATEANRQALLAENVPDVSIHVTGNPVIDALHAIMADASPALTPVVAGDIASRGNRLLLLTTHRRENFGDPQREIFEAMAAIIERHDDVEIIFPMHPNPAVRAAIARHLPAHPRVHPIEPLDYPHFIHLLAKAHLVLTDSGGLQEEAPALGVPVLVLRTTTEREEMIAAGAGLLVGVRRDDIIEAASRVLNDDDAYRALAVPRFPFGAGGAGGRIAAILNADSRFRGDDF